MLKTQYTIVHSKNQIDMFDKSVSCELTSIVSTALSPLLFFVVFIDISFNLLSYPLDYY